MENIRNKDTRPMMDLVAKKVFSNTEVTAQFIRDLLDLPVASVKLLDGAQIHAKPYKDLLPFVTHVDVLAELDDGTQVIIEIQVAMQVDFIKRLWLYICEQVSQNLDEYKKEGVDTHHLSRELIPVYAIAITEKPYFDDNRAIHTFCMRDDENCEELKVKFKGIEEKRNLIRMVFLEIEKYRENTMESYKKIRWIEFFGNKPYTHEPEKIMEQADSIINPRKWSKEEKSMFDERRRDFDGYYAHLAYVREEKEQAIVEGLQQGREQGLQQGREEGKLSTMINLINKGVITKEYACEELGVSEKEFDKYL